jgi:hypothetical protein
MRTDIKEVAALQEFSGFETAMSRARAAVPELTAIELTAWVRLAQQKLKTLETALKPEANQDWLDWKQTHQTSKEMLLCDIAKASTYTPAGTWIYPQAVAKLAAELKAAEKAAQADGTARKLEGSSDTLFSMRLL